MRAYYIYIVLKSAFFWYQICLGNFSLLVHIEILHSFQWRQSVWYLVHSAVSCCRTFKLYPVFCYHNQCSINILYIYIITHVGVFLFIKFPELKLLGRMVYKFAIDFAKLPFIGLVSHIPANTVHYQLFCQFSAVIPLPIW